MNGAGDIGNIGDIGNTGSTGGAESQRSRSRAWLYPIGRRVILRKIETDRVRGIRIPDSADREEYTEAFEIVEVPLAHDESTADCQCVGARVYVAAHKRARIMTGDGEELYVANVEDLLAVEEIAVDSPTHRTDRTDRTDHTDRTDPAAVERIIPSASVRRVLDLISKKES